MQFEAYPKIGRYSRPSIITEKIDGTNAQVLVDVTDDLALWESEPLVTITNWGPITGLTCGIWAGSRKQWIGLKNDNAGFAKWVFEHSAGVQMTELIKCDIVCANCHRMRTWRQKNGLPPWVEYKPMEWKCLGLAQ